MEVRAAAVRGSKERMNEMNMGQGNLRGPYSSIQGGGGVLPPYMVGSSCPVPQDSV
mgnify:CR=1 FL=1